MAEPRWRPTWNTRQLARDMAVKGFRQKDLAERAGVTQATVSRMLRGGSISPKMAAKVARALGQRLDRYFEETDFHQALDGPGAAA